MTMQCWLLQLVALSLKANVQSTDVLIAQPPPQLEENLFT